ncbi:hypothetical protein ES332_D09G009100v1 [Gossypium tomentosum]|uniref:Uncharacterized protein n=1 Tax=Gossypium tomentosum TaxID=34277 RepID=A0A5D2JBI3_GOSTO|nr:hypothetical protein ES332_D09G009100v1 [Gossypium tomentosum]
MSSFTNKKKSSAQKRVLYCHCGLSTRICNTNTSKNKVRKLFGCVNFKEVTVMGRIQLQKNKDVQSMK